MGTNLSITLNTDFDELEQFDAFVTELSGKAGLTDDQFEALQLTASEAVTNAMKHGNGMDPEKAVLVEVEVENDELRFSVEDQGDGFDPGSLPDPLDPANLLKPSGRGVFLMKTYCDDVIHSKGGRRVTLVFHLVNSDNT
jgi:serine/threonine-protein kinase RsbW